MNNRQTPFGNNDWIRPSSNKHTAQHSSIAASSFDMRPPYRSNEKFNNESLTKSSKPISSSFDSRFYEPSSIQTFRAPVNFAPNQNAIYSPRLTHQAPLPSQSAMRASFPASSQFAKIPCNLASVQSSERHNTYSFTDSNVNDNVPAHLSTNQSNISSQYSGYRNPSCDRTNMRSMPNSSNHNFSRQAPPVPSITEFVRPPRPPSSNLSNFIRQPPLATNIPDFERSPFLHGFNKPDTLSSGSGTNDIRQPPPSGSSNPDFIRQPPPSVSSNSGIIRQPPPSGFNNPDCIRQPFPPNFRAQQPPNLPSGNIVSSHLSYSLQIPPSSGVAPFTTLNQDPQFNMFCGPNLSLPPPLVNQDWVEENKINKFVEKFTLNTKSTMKTDLTVMEFRNKLKEAFATITKLMQLKSNLSNLVEANESDWNEKLKETLHYKDKLSKECAFLSEPKNVNLIQDRLKSRKRKREIKKKMNHNRIKENTEKIATREELHHTIDKWLESIKEKNLKLKREAEMKTEADSILAEVRRKIHEAKRTIDKIKVFEKLRSARQANANQKGLFLPDHDEKFQIKTSELKSTLFKQLSDYESEEKALKVMLEAEQEGQLEEEALWRIKKLKNSQQRRQKNIIEALFGNEEGPTEENPIFLFHQFQSSGSKSIESLVQIRHQWDLHLSEDGEAIPSQWVVPVPPSSASWEVASEK